jgi:hypothetical protein
MYNKNIKSFFPTTSRTIILVVMVIGIGAFIYGFNKDTSITLLGLIIFLIAVFIISGYYGIEIDFDEKRYRSYLSFVYILKFGKWKALPDIAKVTLLPEKRFVSKHSLQSNIFNETFLMKLVVEGHDESIIMSRGLYGALLIEAEEISKRINVPLEEF